MSVCTLFCKADCEQDHHPLLIALTNAVDKETTHQFQIILRDYQISGFDLEAEIPDPDQTFRHPLLHWAAVLGNAEVLKILLRPPFSTDMNVRSLNQETALHRSLLLWDSKAALKEIFKVIEELGECLESVNDAKEKPFHICAARLVGCNKSELTFWKEIMNKMLITAQADSLEKNLNHQDINGDTALHIISKRGELLDIVHCYLYYGASFDVRNNRGKSAMDISWVNAINIYNLYHMITSEVGLQRINEDKNEQLKRLTRAAICSSENRSAKKLLTEKRRTRISTGFNETKDYTKFFDSSEAFDTEDFIGKRKVSSNNTHLIKDVETLSENSVVGEQAECKPLPKRQRIYKDISNWSQGNLKLASKQGAPVSNFSQMMTSQCLRDVISIQTTDEQISLVKEITDTIEEIRDIYADHT